MPDEIKLTLRTRGERIAYQEGRIASLEDEIARLQEEVRRRELAVVALKLFLRDERDRETVTMCKCGLYEIPDPDPVAHWKGSVCHAIEKCEDYVDDLQEHAPRGPADP